MLPDFDFGLQLDAHSLGHAVADDVDQLQHILGGGARLGDEEIRVPLAHFDAADAVRL